MITSLYARPAAVVADRRPGLDSHLEPPPVFGQVWVDVTGRAPARETSGKGGSPRMHNTPPRSGGAAGPKLPAVSG